mmetsp:Transcript_26994/g.37681  ORF Transcript_26994/g.37681 Transcript_26994/m.37681 type:complete len:305 (+) Transcript_26994:389-1303(+)
MAPMQKSSNKPHTVTTMSPGSTDGNMHPVGVFLSDGSPAGQWKQQRQRATCNQGSKRRPRIPPDFWKNVSIPLSKEMVSCMICNTTTKKMNFKRHMLRHTGNSSYRAFRCENCSWVFTQKSNLKRHAMLHRYGDQRSCAYCNRTFVTATRRWKHMETHHKPMRCTECGVYLPNHRHLELHLDARHRPPRHRCDKCGRVFTVKRYLHAHMNSTHAPTRKYACRRCLRRFKYKAYLKKHLASAWCKPEFDVERIVSPVPFATCCKECGKFFIREINLLRHCYSTGHMTNRSAGDPCHSLNTKTWQR